MTNFFLYIDPSSGSYLIQMIIAAILGSLFFIKNIWYKIKSFFGGKKTKPDDNIENEL